MNLITATFNFFKNMSSFKSELKTVVKLSEDKESYDIFSHHGYKVNVSVDSFRMFFSYESYKFCLDRKPYNFNQNLQSHERGDDLKSIYTFIKHTGLFNLDERSFSKLISPHSESVYSTDFFLDKRPRHNEVRYKNRDYGFFNIKTKDLPNGLIEVNYQRYDNNKKLKDTFAGYFFGSKFIDSDNLDYYFKSAKNKFMFMLEDEEYDDNDEFYIEFDVADNYIPLKVKNEKTRKLSDFINFAYSYLDLKKIKTLTIDMKHVTQYVYDGNLCFLAVSHKDSEDMKDNDSFNYFTINDGHISIEKKKHKKLAYAANMYILKDGQTVHYSGFVTSDVSIQYYTDIFEPFYNNEEILKKHASQKLIAKMRKEGIIGENSQPTLDDLEVFKMLLI